MFAYTVGLQGRGKEDVVIDAIHKGASAAEFSRLRAAYAYASAGGAAEIVDTLRAAMPNWDLVAKKWLVSMDWGHTDPRALLLLASLEGSEVRVPYADEVLAHGLDPRTCFHPKTLILDRENGRAPVTIAIGSANLTVSGLRTGHEDVSVATWSGGSLRTAERNQLAALLAEAAWFDKVWRRASILTTTLLDSYIAVRPKRKFRSEDTSRRVVEIEKSRAADYDRTASLLAATRMWVEVWNVAHNLGAGQPGNQLHMQRGCRVFFGMTPLDVPPMTALGTIDIEYGGHETPRNMRFGHNKMDTLDLPIPGVDGPATYENKVLLFRRISDGVFALKVGTTAEVRRWKDKSAAEGTSFAMSSGREWGVFG